MGLHKSIKKFDLSKRIAGKPLALSTYATWWIRQAVTRAIDNGSRTIRIPIHKLNEYRTIKKKFWQFISRHGHKPTAEELEIIIRQAAEEDPKIKSIGAKDIELLGRMLYPMVYLDQSNSDDENLTIMDYLSSEEEDQPENKAESSVNTQYLNSLLDYLEPDERMIIMLKYGLIDGKQRDKKALVSSLRGANEEDVQKTIDRILLKLKNLGDRNRVNLE